MMNRTMRATTVNALKRKPKRIILIGSTRCGKTALVHRFIQGRFTTDYTPTIEECYHYQCTYKRIVWNLEIIDLCAPFMFPVMRDLNVKSAHIVLLVYEIDNNASIQEIISACKQIKDVRSDVPIILVGSKLDLTTNKQRVSAHTLLHNLDDDTRHILTSAKDNIGVIDVFHSSLDDIIKRDPTIVIFLTEEDVSSSQNKKKCCEIL